MISFGTFEVDLQAGELRKQGRKIKLQEKPLLLLSILLERPGEVVTREELQKRLWPEDTFVNFTQGLNTAVAKLRSALGDPADNPRFVETVRRRGYRFLAPVRREEIASEPPRHESREPVEPVSKATRSRRNYLVLVALMVALTGVLITMVVMNWRLPGQGRGGGAGLSRLDSLAVLPLDNLMDDPEQDYFVDGMTDLLIANLAQISTLRVTSRTSTVHYKNARKTLPVIAQELGVAAVVEGSVLRSGDRVRITVQLVEAAGDRHLWAESYEREFGDVLTLQNELAQAISREVHVVLTQQERERLAGARPVNPDAYEAYLQGRYFWNQRTEAGLERALEYFEQAIEEDPDFALAYVGLADSYLVQRAPAAEAIHKAKAAITKALELDPTIAEAHATLGLVKAHFEFDWAGAEQSFRTATARSPSYATAHHWYGIFLSLMGRPDESYAEMTRALELDPSSVIMRVDLGQTFLVAGELDRAIEECQKGLRMDPDFVAGHSWLGLAYVQKGMYAEGIAELQTALDLDRSNTMIEAILGYAYAVSGNVSEAHTRLDRFTELWNEGENVSGEIALIYLAIGENERAIDWLERAHQNHDPLVLRLLRLSSFDGLRSEPRFQELVRRLNFPS